MRFRLNAFQWLILVSSGFGCVFNSLVFVTGIDRGRPTMAFALVAGFLTLLFIYGGFYEGSKVDAKEEQPV